MIFALYLTMIRYWSIEYSKDEPPKVTNKESSVIPKLLCAARTQDEDTIRSVLKNILQDGVDEEDVNTVDCSGRVSNLLIFMRIASLRSHNGCLKTSKNVKMTVFRVRC